MPSILEAHKPTNFLRGNNSMASETHFDESLLWEAGSALNPKCFSPSHPNLGFPPLGQPYLHDLVSNLQPSNFSRASLRYPCDVNALERDNPGKALWSLDWPFTHRAQHDRLSETPLSLCPPIPPIHSAGMDCAMTARGQCSCPWDVPAC